MPLPLHLWEAAIAFRTWLCTAGFPLLTALAWEGTGARLGLLTGSVQSHPATIQQLPGHCQGRAAAPGARQHPWGGSRPCLTEVLFALGKCRAGAWLHHLALLGHKAFLKGWRCQLCPAAGRALCLKSRALAAGAPPDPRASALRALVLSASPARARGCRSHPGEVFGMPLGNWAVPAAGRGWLCLPFPDLLWLPPTCRRAFKGC